MKATSFQQACFDTLSSAGITNNQIVLRGQGTKKVDSIVASWAPVAGAGDPALLRTGRIIIAIGELSPENLFIDPRLPVDVNITGLEKILRDILTTTGTHKVIQLGELGVIVSPGSTLSIIQTCMYVSGDANGTCSPTLATLNVGASQLYADGKNSVEIKLR